MDSSTPGFPVLHTLLSLRKLMSLESVMPSLEVGRLGLSASFLVFGESTQPFTIKYVLHQVGEMPCIPSWLIFFLPNGWRLSIALSVSLR